MAALKSADKTESSETARHTLRIMIKSAEEAESNGQFVCSDSGVPVYFVRVGTRNGHVQRRGGVERECVGYCGAGGD